MLPTKTRHGWQTKRSEGPVTCRDMDSVQLVIEIEDCFGITIPDEDAEKLDTVSDCFEYVRQRVPVSNSTDCLSAKAYYRLRRALVNLLKCDRTAIRPETRFDVLFPRETRRAQWAELGRLLGLKLFPLQRPVWAVAAIVATTLLLLAGGVFWPPHFLWLLAAPFAYASVRLTRPWAVQTRRYPTVGSLVPVVLEEYFLEFTKQGASDQQVWDALVSIMCTSLGMNRSDITFDLRFKDIESDL